jgi:hypothetical protein
LIVDPKELVDLTSRAFSEFEFLTFVQKRARLRGGSRKLSSTATPERLPR